MYVYVCVRAYVRTYVCMCVCATGGVRGVCPSAARSFARTQLE